jgi:hypothetical protein
MATKKPPQKTAAKTAKKTAMKTATNTAARTPPQTTTTTTSTVAEALSSTRKSRLVAALRASLARALAPLEAAAHAAHDAATHPEARPENDKDTRALEAGYLAGAQSARAAELKRALAECDRAPITAFAVLSLREEVKGRSSDHVVLLSPWGGGEKLNDDGGVVAVVTPHSPLGAALVGRKTGDVVQVEMGARVREIEVVDVE